MKETKKEMEKIFPAEIVLRGKRYYPEEYFNPNFIKRDIFNDESVDLENLFILGTLAEGREFIGKITSQGIKKWNEHETWQKTLCFKPVYGEDVILVGGDWIEIAENPVSYFLLEGDLIP